MYFTMSSIRRMFIARNVKVMEYSSLELTAAGTNYFIHYWQLPVKTTMILVGNGWTQWGLNQTSIVLQTAFQMIFLNTLRPRQNGRRFADDTFKRIFLNENVRISIKISLRVVPKDPINNNPALVQIMAWRRSGDKPLSEPMMVGLLTHICVTRPQWVKKCCKYQICSKSA